MRRLALAFLLPLSMAAGCSDEADGKDPRPGADAGDAGPAGVDPYNGDCTTARWVNTSDECWSCVCNACAATLNACDEACGEIFECALEKQTLVDVVSEIECEVRATFAECIATPETQAVAQQVVDFDGCLIGAPKPSGFRVCEDVCNIPYPGDVCERYPAP